MDSFQCGNHVGEGIMATLTKSERQERYQTATERLAEMAAANWRLPEGVCLSAPTIWLVPMGRVGQNYAHTCLMLDENGELCDIGRYVHWLTGLRLKKNTSWVVTRYASDIAEQVNWEFEKLGHGPLVFRWFAL